MTPREFKIEVGRPNHMPFDVLFYDGKCPRLIIYYDINEDKYYYYKPKKERRNVSEEKLKEFRIEITDLFISKIKGIGKGEMPRYW